MAWVVVGGAAVSLVGGAIANNQANKGAKGAANAAERGNNAAIASQERARDQMRTDMQPYMGLGTEATLRLGELGRGDMSSFVEDPGRQFALEQGYQALDRSASANGRLMSGGYSADLLRYGQGEANQTYGAYYGRLMGLAGMGQNAAAGVGQAGMQAANNIGGYQSNAGYAQGAGIQGRADANSRFAGQLAGGLSSFANNRGTGNSSPASLANFGNNPGFQNTNWGGAGNSGSLTGYAGMGGYNGIFGGGPNG